jgi:hypothetical protein
MKKFTLILFAIIFSNLSFGQGIKGKIIISETGEPLAFATIYIKQLETGTSTNLDGDYSFPLKAGKYDVYFQYLGYEAIRKEITVSNQFVELDIVMKTQAMQLSEVEINSKAEDPAYTIIRKAIAKSKFHLMQVDAYNCKVYMKGGGKLNDVPFLFRKALEKDGVDTSTVYLTESVSEVSYTRPNTFKEKVTSIRTIGKSESGGVGPNRFITSSFYNPTVGESISPLSPKSFAYYRFKYQGSFMEGGREINKIAVMPRVRGEQVFEGTIFIVEDVWSIHSLDLTTYTQGFKFKLSQIYNPIKEQVWLPVSHRFNISGSFMGFDLEYKYLATVSNYQITLNPDLKMEEIVVIDEKAEKALAKELESKNKNTSTNTSENPFAGKKEFTRKDLKKLMKEYEKEEEKEMEEPEVVSNTSITVDSLAGKKDSTYWEEIRPVPLSKLEVRSYVKLDSIAVVEELKVSNPDSVKEKKESPISKLLFGTSSKRSKKTRFVYKSPISTVRFNTVDGYNFEVPFQIKSKLSKNKNLEISPTFRYGFTREEVNGKMNVKYAYKSEKSKGNIQLEGGRYVAQFNEQNPIHPIINSFSSLLYEQNYMKIYEKSYLKLSLNQTLSDKITIKPSVEWAERTELFNNTSHSWRNVDDRKYTLNAPANLEAQNNTGFAMHQALLASVELEYRPFVKYRVRNKKREAILEGSPVFRLNYSKGISDVASSDVDFDRLEIGMQHQFKVGARGKLNYNIFAGSFLNANQLYFMDYKHFMGNRTVLQVTDPVASYRLLNYYALSTQRNYAGAHLNYQFRKFLLTQIWEVRMTGIKENFIFNYLGTNGSSKINLPNNTELNAPSDMNYMEVGYSLDNIFRFFRIEAIASFKDMEYQDFGIRIGIATSIGSLVSVN